jgi:hypothetical protein
MAQHIIASMCDRMYAVCMHVLPLVVAESSVLLVISVLWLLLLAAVQDDIERLLEYVAIGPRFSNAILQVCACVVNGSSVLLLERAFRSSYCSRSIERIVVQQCRVLCASW